MRVRCVSNQGESLPYLYLDPDGGYDTNTVFPLTREKEYTVYALTVRRGGIWYYVLDDSGVRYPVWHPAALFEIRDGRPSRYWMVGLVDQGLQDGSAVLALPEWARDPLDYYDRLTDGDPGASSSFAKYCELMDREFLNDNAEPVAGDLQDGWLLCPICRWAWHYPARGKSIICPNCKTSLNNPAL